MFGIQNAKRKFLTLVYSLWASTDLPSSVFYNILFFVKYTIKRIFLYLLWWIEKYMFFFFLGVTLFFIKILFQKKRKNKIYLHSPFHLYLKIYCNAVLRLAFKHVFDVFLQKLLTPNRVQGYRSMYANAYTYMATYIQFYLGGYLLVSMSYQKRLHMNIHISVLELQKNDTLFFLHRSWLLLWFLFCYPINFPCLSF